MRLLLPLNLITLLYFCTTVDISRAQCPDSSSFNITSTLYSRENGLPSNMLMGISSDKTGYRYFLSIDNQWIRYDGVHFDLNKKYNKIDFDHYRYADAMTAHTKTQYINGITCKQEETNDGDIFRWAITGDSLYHLDIQKQQAEKFILPEELRSVPYINLFPNGDVCWLTLRNQVFRFDFISKKFTRIHLPAIEENNVSMIPLSIFCLSDTATYVIFGNKVLRLNKNSDSFRNTCTFSSALFPAWTMDVVQDQYVWIAERNSILHQVNLLDGTVLHYDLSAFIQGVKKSALDIITIRNFQHKLLIATSNAGLFIFNHCTKTMQHFQYERQNAKEDLTNSISWIATDDENVIWMQTDAGLLKLEINQQGIKTYKPSSMRPDGVCNDCNNVRAIYSLDDNSLLIGSLKGLFSFDAAAGKFNHVLSPVDHQPFWEDQPVSSITGDGHGNIFIADWGNTGIMMYNPGKKKLVNILPHDLHPELSFLLIRYLFYDSHHVLWVGTSDGVLRINNLDAFEKNGYQGKIEVSQHDYNSEHLNASVDNTCFAITEDSDHNIWFGTSHGVYVFNEETNSTEKYMHDPNMSTSLSDDDIRSMYLDHDQQIWIGTNSGGLNLFNPADKTFTAYTSENGLANNSIYSILEDQHGFLWLGTNAGLCRFEKQTHAVRNFTPRDGIQNYEFNSNAISSMPDGRFCFGGRTGFNIFYPDEMNQTASTPKAVITRFRIFDQDVDFSGGILHLPHDQNSFTFDFSTLSYYRNIDNQYSYILTGADKTWINAGNRSSTSYGNLTPGKYTFKVRAANYTGTWSDEETLLLFIKPAWYNTWWFRVFMILIVACGAYFLYLYRIRQVMKLQSIRNRIASDLHDEIGSTLSSISLSSTIIQRKLNGSQDEVLKLLRQVSHNTDSMMEALSDIVWAINTRNDRFDNVVNRMRAFAIELSEPSNIRIDFNVSPEMDEIHLDMQHRKNLYLIFKEAMHNIVKYAHCKNVFVDIQREGRWLVMKVRDDGIGFDSPASDQEISLSGNGIINMKKRAEEMKGQLKIQSEKNKGTSILLTFSV